MKLNEWAVHHIRFKDSMRRKIKDLQVTDHHIKVIEKHELKDYYVNENLSNALENIQDVKHKQFIITTNNRENVQTLLKNWDELTTYRNLNIIFANVKENRSWHINPATHHFIADKKTFKEGIWHLHESIPRS
ncbi:MAG: hypothetical protein ACLFTH_04380 [Candidatus Woesearchaeota archaeon]